VLSVEPFKIICETCQAKLSVRNESLIGKIVACPRCDSMVEITPPTAAASLSVTAVEAVVSELPTTASSASPILPESVADVSAATEQTAHSAAEQAATLAASAEATKVKIIVWSLASFLIGATFVGGVLYSRSPSTKEATAQLPTPQKTSPASIDPAPPTPKEPVAHASAIVATPPKVPHPVTPKADVPEPTGDVPEPIFEASVGAQAEAELAAQSSPLTHAAKGLTPEQAPRIARRFDPLDFDPESLTLATVDRPIVTVEPLASDALDEPVKISEEVPSTLPLVRRGPDANKEARERDALKHFALLIPQVKIDAMSLVDCLRLFSQLSGVPVSVAPEQLLMAGISPKRKVSLDATELSLGEMLNRILKPLHLTYAAQGAQVVVVRQEATKHREINYPTSDLVSAETSEEQLASWVEQLVAPTSWQSAGGEGTLEATTGILRIEATQQVQYQVLILLERLRLARKLPPKGHYPVERLVGIRTQALLQERLAKSTTFTFSQFTPIDDIFVHWQTELGAPLLIDWPALAEAEIWPATPIACAIREQPWFTALEKVLEPLGLGWRAVAGGAIEITSAEKVQSELQLEHYFLQRDFDGDTAQLRAMAKQHTAGVIRYDPTGKVLLVLESAAVQRLILQRLQEQGLLRESSAE